MRHAARRGNIEIAPQNCGIICVAFGLCKSSRIFFDTLHQRLRDNPVRTDDRRRIPAPLRRLASSIVCVGCRQVMMRGCSRSIVRGILHRLLLIIARLRFYAGSAAFAKLARSMPHVCRDFASSADSEMIATIRRQQ